MYQETSPQGPNSIYLMDGCFIQNGLFRNDRPISLAIALSQYLPENQNLKNKNKVQKTAKGKHKMQGAQQFADRHDKECLLTTQHKIVTRHEHRGTAVTPGTNPSGERTSHPSAFGTWT
jgi:hypothetical protein